MDHLLLGIAQGQHPHGPGGQLVDLPVHHLRVDVPDLAPQAHIAFRPGQQPLRCPLVKGLAQIGQIGLAELVGGVEALALRNGAAALQLGVYLRPDELHQGLVCGVSADDIALAVEHGLAVFADSQVQQAFGDGVLVQLLQGDGDAPGSEELHHLQPALGNGARLVAEQDVQGTRRLDALGLAHQHVVVQHFTGILHQHQRDHQGQPLGHGAHHNDHRQGQGIHRVFQHRDKPLGQIVPKAPRHQHRVAQVHGGDDHRADIAEFRDQPCQPGQLYL